jgi:hypothetical protein
VPAKEQISRDCFDDLHPRRQIQAVESICLDEFGEYLGGLLPVMGLTGSVVDFETIIGKYLAGYGLERTGGRVFRTCLPPAAPC